jgi:uncharacterized CHY-type Zn-finger protein
MSDDPNRKQPIYRTDSQGHPVLICPNCFEKIQPADVEAYPYCPYCNYRLPSDDQLEDFILGPVVSTWVSKTFPGF